MGPTRPDSVAREFDRASALLAAAVLEGSKRPDRRERRRLTDLNDRIRTPSLQSRARNPERELARRLVAYADGDRARRSWLTDRLRHAPHILARHGTPPQRGARAVAWRAVILAAGRLHDSLLRRLPPRPFLDPPLLDALIREGHAQRPAGRSHRRQHGMPGPALARLAVDRRLQRAATRALGFPVEPAYLAVYIYDPPRSHVPPHMDSKDFEIIVHLVLEHQRPTGRAGSALVVHRRSRDVRMAVEPGDAIVLAGRGAVHQWEPLAARESRTLIGIGFRRIAPRS